MNSKNLFQKLTLILAIALFSFTNTTFASQWSYKRKISTNNPGNKASNAVIEIQLKTSDFDYSKAKPDGADIRFSTTSGELKGDGLSYWIEQWNENGVTRIWVKVPVLKSKSQNDIFMFYGNSEANSVSNGDATFLFFDDFEDGDYTKKWTNTSVGEVVERDGSLQLKETDGQDGIVTAKFEITGRMIVRALYQRGGADGHWVRAGIGGWNKWFCFGDHTDTAASGTNYAMLFDSASITSLKSAPLAKKANTVINDKWRSVTYWYDGKTLKGKQDDVTVEWPLANASSKLALRTLDNDSWDNFAFITVSPYLGFEPDIVIGKQENN